MKHLGKLCIFNSLMTVLIMLGANCALADECEDLIFEGKYSLASSVCKASAAMAEECKELIAVNKYSLALPVCKASAEKGNAESQTNLGFMYDTGFGVHQDYKEAVKWYTKAAEQGDPLAQSNLGVHYETGSGVTKDYREAIKWLRKSANQGEDSAEWSLGTLYDKARNYKEAAKWYRKAAEQWFPAAQFKLGKMYASGQGVTKDYIQAYMWFELAKRFTGEAYVEKEVNSLTPLMTPAQISKAKALAQTWKQTHPFK